MATPHATHATHATHAIYIALLRGINVSGQKKVKMADLREQCTAMGLGQVQTYIQSGNVVFTAPTQENVVIEQALAQMMLEKFGYTVGVLVRTTGQMAEAIAGNTFIHQRNEDPKKVYLTFLNQAPEPAKVQALQAIDYAPEEWLLAGLPHNPLIYFYSPNGYGRAKMNNNFFEQKLKVGATTRNWATVNKLLAMAQALG